MNQRTLRVARFATRAALTASLYVLAACSGLQQHTPPEKRAYLLEALRSPATSQTHPAAVARSAAAKGQASVVLKVGELRVSPRFQAKELVYRTADNEYAADFYNSFFVAPGRNLTEQTQRWLAAADIFDIVIDSASQIPSAYILDGIVTELYADLRPNPGEAVLAVHFFLIDDRDGRNEVVLQREYRSALPLESRSAAALVQAWDMALCEILERLEADVRTALAPKPLAS